jgi:hypothetical protein
MRRRGRGDEYGGVMSKRIYIYCLCNRRSNGIYISEWSSRCVAIHDTYFIVAHFHYVIKFRDDDGCIWRSILLV